MDIILSHPFSGSLYAFFTEQARGEKIPDIIGHPYYQTLYGKKHAEVRDLALTQLLLHEKVFIIPADNHMPDVENWEQAYQPGKYSNDKLGLYTDWSIHDELRESVERDIEIDLLDPVLSKILAKVPIHSKRQILRDCRFEIALANRYECPILSAGGRTSIIKRLCDIDQSPTNNAHSVNPRIITATESYIDIIGLTFNPTNYELLYEYKQDREVRLYAKAFREIISKFDDSLDVRTGLLRLVRENIENQALRKKTSGILDVSSILLSIAGFFPPYGTLFSGTSLLATGISKVLEGSAKRRWYEFGPRIQKLTDLKAIEKKIDKELALIQL
jgi:hypothetical protein